MLQNSIIIKKVLVSVGTILLGSGIGIFPLTCLGDTKPPTFTGPPTIVQNPNPRVPLAAVIRFSTDEPVRTKITVSDGKRAWDIAFDDSYKPAEGLPIIGMRPNQQHQFHISIRDAADNETNAPEVLQFTTPPLPSNPKEFPPIDIPVKHIDKMEPGFTMLSVRRRMPGRGHWKFNRGFGMLLTLDSEGEVVWYCRFDERISDFKRLYNGNLVYITQDYRVIEIDLLGNIVQSWYAKDRPQGLTAKSIPVETVTFHHEIDELPSRNFVVLGIKSRMIDNYYTSETDPNAPRKTQQVIGDQIIEFQRDGKIVWHWNAFEHLDPFRIGYQTLNDYWAIRGFPKAVDWTHANGLLYNNQDDSLLISMRKQDAVVKIDRATGQIKWIIGEPSGWPVKLHDRLLKQEGKMRWFYHQHAPRPTPAGLLLFDNGTFQARPFNPSVSPANSYSRAVEYAIDEEKMTVREIWSSEKKNDEDTVVSYAMGDVGWLPKMGNILVAYGWLLPQDEISKITWDNVRQFPSWSRVREYTHTNPPELVWEAVMKDDSQKKTIGWIIFGAERIQSLSPSHNGN